MHYVKQFFITMNILLTLTACIPAQGMEGNEKEQVPDPLNDIDLLLKISQKISPRRDLSNCDELPAPHAYMQRSWERVKTHRKAQENGRRRSQSSPLAPTILASITEE